MTMQNVITLSEDGLLLNTLGKDTKRFNANLAVRKEDLILFADDTSVTLYDLAGRAVIRTYDVVDTKEIKLTDCGKICSITTYSKKMYICDHSGIVSEPDLVENFDISRRFLVSMSKHVVQIYDMERKEISGTIEQVGKFILSGHNLIYTTLKKEDGKMNLVFMDLNQVGHKRTYEFANIEDIKLKSNAEYTFILILVTTDYVQNSYFGSSSLFLLNCQDGVLKEFSGVEKVLFFEFLKNDIVICCDHQPSDVIIFNLKMVQIKRFPKGIRNRVYFNPHANLVCFAGFDNMSGFIEIYSTELLAKIKVLGASEVIWSPCGSYFIVAVTNKLRVDNRIIIYDYYGRLISEKKFDNLIDCAWYGKAKEFKVLERPAVLNIPNESEYVPPHLRRNQEDLRPYAKAHTSKKRDPKHKKDEKPPKKVVKDKKEESTDIDQLKVQLEEIKELKKRIAKGECLDMENLNKVLKEDEIVRRIPK